MRRHISFILFFFLALALNLDAIAGETTKGKGDHPCLENIRKYQEEENYIALKYSLSDCAAILSDIDAALYLQQLTLIKYSLLNATKWKDLSDSQHQKLLQNVLFFSGLANQEQKNYSNATHIFKHYEYLASSGIDGEFETKAHLNDIKKKKQWSDVFKKPIDEFTKKPVRFIILLILLLIILIWAKKENPANRSFQRENSSQTNQGKKKMDHTLSYGKLIPLKKPGLIKESIIELQEMCHQDGRVTYGTCNTVKEDPSRHGEGCNRARSMFKAHGMIEHVNQMMPWPLWLISHVYRLIGRQKSALPSFWIILGSAAVFSVFWSLVSYNLGGLLLIGDNVTGTLVMTFLNIALLGSGLTAIKIMTEKTIDSLDELVSMLELKDTEKLEAILRKFEAEIWSMFRSHMHIFIALLYITGAAIFIPACMEKAVPWWEWLFIVPFIAFLSPITWFIIKSINIVHMICSTPKLAVNPLSPMKTLGLEQWISLIGTFAICASVVVAFGCSLPAVYSYIDKSYNVASWAWMTLLPLLIVYWIYPYQKLGELVRSIKNKRMNFFKNKIYWLFLHWRDQDEKLLDRAGYHACDQSRLAGMHSKELERLKENIEALHVYKDMFDYISKSPTSYFDLNSFLKLLQALGIPSLFALFSALFL